MKRSWCLALALFLAFVPFGAAHAQTVKIGVFDLQRIIKESHKIEGYRQELLKNTDAKRKLFRDKEESIRLVQERLKKGGQAMSPDERRGLEEKQATEVKELKRLGEDFDQEIQKMDRELTRKALMDIDVVIKKIAEREGFSLIINKSAGVVYFKDSLDITAKIIKEL